MLQIYVYMVILLVTAPLYVLFRGSGLVRYCSTPLMPTWSFPDVCLSLEPVWLARDGSCLGLLVHTGTLICVLFENINGA
jgi:hypothetical protein